MFTTETSKGDSIALIPNGTLHFASVNVQGLGNSQRTGGRYAKLELILIDGPYQGRRIYTVVMDPTDPKNVNQEARNAVPPKADGAKMGLTALCRMFEACRIFDASNPASYKRFDGVDFPTIVTALANQRIGIKIKLTPAKDGYDEKNEVGEFLTPNPGSNISHLWTKLIGGQGAVQQARAGAFGAPAAPAGFIQPPRPTAPVQQWPAAGAANIPQPAPAPAADRPAWVDEAPKQNPFG